MEVILQLNNCKIACITEHFLRKDECEQLRISSYNVSSCYCRTQTKGGGSLILTHQSLECTSVERVNHLSVESQCEICCIFVPKQNFFVISVYRSPTVITTQANDYEVFLVILEQALNLISWEGRVWSVLV